MGQVITYTPADRPVVEVLVDERDEMLMTILGASARPGWYYGELRMWRQLDDGSWVAQVGWTFAPGNNRIDDFNADRVREMPDQEIRRPLGYWPLPVDSDGRYSPPAGDK